MTFFKAAVFTMLLVCSVAVNAQSITGEVKSVAGVPVPFASIEIKHTVKKVIADSRGAFALNIAPGSYEIIVTAEGYGTIEKTIAFNKDGKHTILMDTASRLLKEVVVVATKNAVAKSIVPYHVTVVGQNQIENSSESALLPVLSQQVPGLFITQRGVTGFGVAAGAAGAISMRGIAGSPNNRVLVLINGSPQFMGIFGHPLADAYVASDVQKVEVLHGAGSVLYGTNAMGGVVNIITKSQQRDGLTVNARLLMGSYNTQKYLANIGFKKNKLSVFASFNHDRTDGHRTNSDFKITNGYVKINYQASSHFTVSTEHNLAAYEAGDPGPQTGTKGQRIDITRGASYLTVQNKYAHTSGAVQLFYNYGRHKITDGFRSKDANYGLSIYQSAHLFKHNSITAGFDFKNYGGRAENIYAMNGQGILFGDHSIQEWAPYLFTQQTIKEKITLSAGIRYENNSVYGGVLVPSGGLTYQLSENTSIKASVSKGFRSPTMQELYLFVPANDSLQPEKMMNYEASVKQLLLNKQLSLELTLFKVEGNNLIQTVVNGGLPKNRNTGSFSNTGIECSINYQLNNLFTVGINYAYTDLKKPVVAAPKHLLTANIAARFNKFNWSVNLQQVSGLYTTVNPVAVTSSYFIANSRLAYQLNAMVSLFVKGENLTNTTYQINAGYPMPGAVIMGGVHFNLSRFD
ncbi:MAG: hypothetical protein RL172_1529 [Bacteroidota bacterium]